MFFNGAIHTCTFYNKGYFSQAQMALVYDVTLQTDIDNWQLVKLLLTPPAMKSIQYDSNKTKKDCIGVELQEISIGVCNVYTHRLQVYKQGKRK